LVDIVIRIHSVNKEIALALSQTILAGKPKFLVHITSGKAGFHMRMAISEKHVCE
jgi:hypothetical protein